MAPERTAAGGPYDQTPEKAGPVRAVFDGTGGDCHSENRIKTMTEATASTMRNSQRRFFDFASANCALAVIRSAVRRCGRRVGIALVPSDYKSTEVIRTGFWLFSVSVETVIRSLSARSSPVDR